ncbi:Verru_Chthon cassette protein B [Terrimicrobium sacchariphilum]|uniref:Verru_Chthon cassette protein B n=1 Tax=Terrimicrobium sacchariphilum TaxID=690879 RepID=A0A146G6T2_TERSA|nr:prepilin-type N-terminal cleavage/methylation domain-containing protein [Terrimicrobium sacchariphilum]GAT32644.1 Verru_Chthon cassette protein B [Terrimicrobium sacchariphilum]
MPRVARARAFSLIEVAISLAIIGMALVAIIGLMPVAMRTTRESMDRTLCAQILETTIMSIGENSWKPSFSLPATTYHYDDQGMLMTNAASWKYRVSIETNPIVLPQRGSPSQPLNASDGLSVRIGIENATLPGQTNWFPVVIANQGR